MNTDSFDVVIGLETHVQLRTRTKMFCPCPNTCGAPPNTAVCPTCLGLPGALPVANRRAFEFAILAGLALGCEVASFTRFDRKNYFYPDLPKGYQISQLALPINGRGRLDLQAQGHRGSVGITRAHLEEDAGKNIHGGKDEGTRVDLNRCGIPLLEIVTDPDINSAQMAHDYLTELKLLMRHVGVSDCNMEKGSLRCDVNISLKPRGSEQLGKKVELKNLNSFKMVMRGIEYEIARQSALLCEDGDVISETRLWDDAAGETRCMRRKEESADYRYFPDPDLPPFDVPKSWVDELRSGLPELPAAKRQRFVDELGMSEYDAAILIRDRAVADFFEETSNLTGEHKLTANWICGTVFADLNETGRKIGDLVMSPALLAELIGLVQDGTLSNSAAQEVYHEIKGSGDPPLARAEAMGLIQLSDEAELEVVVRAGMEANPGAVEEIRSGNPKARGAIVGYVMKETGGRANPRVVNAIIDRLTA